MDAVVRWFGGHPLVLPIGLERTPIAGPHSVRAPEYERYVQLTKRRRVRFTSAALLFILISFHYKTVFTNVLRRLTGSLVRSVLACVPLRRRPVQKNFLANLPAVAGKNLSDPSTLSSFGAYHEALPTWLAEGLQREGYGALKPIQRAVLPLALRGSNVVGIAPTGSGKTLAFLVPALVHAAGQPSPRGISDGPLALVLAPTRELAVQINSVADGLLRRGKQHSDLSSVVLYGGAPKIQQLQALRHRRHVHLMIATPGRLLDLMRNHNAFRLRLVSFFVLDEGDRMLDFGFEEDVTAISNEIRPDRQMLFFSATWPPEVERAASCLCGRGMVAQKVSIGTNDHEEVSGFTLPPKEIRQIVEIIPCLQNLDARSSIDKKVPLLLRHLEAALGGEVGPTPGKALIFVRTRIAAEELGSTVARRFGLNRCGVMHGQRKQDQRESTLQAFRDGRLRALVATDVLGRGVDIHDVSHVVIFDFPDDIETYVHRVGRTGRNGRPGTSIAFFEPQYWNDSLAVELAEILRVCGQPVPDGLDIGGTVPASNEKWLMNQGQPGVSEWRVDEASIRSAPPLDADGGPGLATAEELGEWDASGARVWGYSANGGFTEQGRLEFRTGGRLRTTWGWGEWRLQQQLMVISWNGVEDVVQLDGLGFELVERNGQPAHKYKKKTMGRALCGVEL